MSQSENLIKCYIKKHYEDKHNQNIPMLIVYLIINYSKKCIGFNYLSVSEDLLLVQLLIEHLKFNPTNFKLIFRASDNKYSAEAFHKICDENKFKNNLIIMKSNHGNIFGGFTTKSWLPNSPHLGHFISDTDAFLFLVRSCNPSEQKKCPLIFKIKTPKHAICTIPDSGPIFGEGWDIFIGDQCHIKKENSRWYSQSVNCAKLVSYGNDKFPNISNICGGDQRGYHYWSQESDYNLFTIIDYEVYHVLK